MPFNLMVKVIIYRNLGNTVIGALAKISLFKGIVTYLSFIKCNVMKNLLLILIIPFLSFGQEFQSNLPIVIINTNGNTIVDNPRIICDMGIVYNHSNMNQTSRQKDFFIYI